jgi:hypothetical protein
VLSIAASRVNLAAVSIPRPLTIVAHHLRRFRAHRFGNAVFGAALLASVAIGVTQLMMVLGFG